MRRALALLVLAAGLARPAAADTAPRFEAGCAPGGALRQTIVLLDETLVTAPTLGDKATLRWSRPILEIADALGKEPGRNLVSHERLTVLLARRSGEDLVPLFTGCSPELSTAELDRLKAKDTTLSRFFGSGSSAQLQGRRDGFQAALLQGLGQALPLGVGAAGAGSAATKDSFFRSVRSGGRFIDLAQGVPRVLMIAAFEGAGPFAGGPAARRAGFDEAAAPSLDLGRAEAYALALREHDAPFLRDYLDAYLLRSRAVLAGWRTSGLPILRAAPRVVSVFAGTIDYAGAPRPARLRLALDHEDNLVNSWIEVTTERPVDTPLAGKAVCEPDKTCRLTGDGTLLGQSWNPEGGETGGSPAFGPKLPFGGFRYFEIATRDAGAQGRIFDPKARVEIKDEAGKPQVFDAFTFDLARQRKARF